MKKEITGPFVEIIYWVDDDDVFHWKTIDRSKKTRSRKRKLKDEN